MKKSKLDKLFLIGTIIFLLLVIYICLATWNHHECAPRICRKGYDCLEQVNKNSLICKNPLFDDSATATTIRSGVIMILFIIDAIINIILVVGYLKKKRYKRIILPMIMSIPTLFFSIIIIFGYLGII